MKSRSLYKPASSQRAETVLFSTLGIVGLLSIIIATASMSDFVRGKDRVVAALSGNSQSFPQNLALVRYINSGRLLADMRTLMAMTRYVLEPETGAQTNLGISGATPGQNALTNNSAAAVPKA